eukprot:4922978-Pyramimonas_sp.AAC.2
MPPSSSSLTRYIDAGCPPPWAPIGISSGKWLHGAGSLAAPAARRVEARPPRPSPMARRAPPRRRTPRPVEQRGSLPG